nr:uncharacterized protein LOC109421177 [Aedes albopictus]
MTPTLRKKIAIGSTLVSAHKGQVRIRNDSAGRRRNATLQVPKPDSEERKTNTNPEEMEEDQQSRRQQRSSKRSRTERDESDDEFYGFDITSEQPLPASRELHPCSLPPSQQPRQHSTDDVPVLRRSCRTKKKKTDAAFVYTKVFK